MLLIYAFISHRKRWRWSSCHKLLSPSSQWAQTESTFAVLSGADYCNVKKCCLLRGLSRWRYRFLGREPRASIITGTTSVSVFRTLAISTFSSEKLLIFSSSLLVPPCYIIRVTLAHVRVFHTTSFIFPLLLL